MTARKEIKSRPATEKEVAAAAAVAATIEAMMDPVVITDLDGKIAQFNTALTMSHGWGREVIGKLSTVLVARRDSPRVMDGIRECRETGFMKNLKCTGISKDKREFPFSLNIAWMKDSQGNPTNLLVAGKDMTELESAREELRESSAHLSRSYRELVHSEKLAFTGRIAASIAHEIRNPLANVLMSVLPLKKSFGSDDQKNKHIEIIERNTERINFLITELLNCARPPKLVLRPCDMHKLIRDVLGSNRAKTKSQNIRAVKNFTRRPAMLEIDREQIQRTLSNMVINAIDAMPKGGTLTISTGYDGGLFVTKIQDTGKGIREEDIIRIFDPFFSTKSGGVGLGLTLCYGVIVSHGGTIEVESKPRLGSTFAVSLPVELDAERGRVRTAVMQARRKPEK